MQNMHRALLSACFVASSLAAWPPGVPELPELNWVPRSDWLSVSSFGAVGDGKHDDTIAIQKALDAVSLSHDGAAPNKTVYIPAGTFLVTASLVINRTQGVLLVGTGRSTTLLWGGGSAPAPPPDGGSSRLLWTDGANRFHIEGLVFDGAGEGGVGLDHDSHTEYESRVMHRSLAFVNWRDAGIRVGHNQYNNGGVASAEMVYSNLVFANNTAGIGFDAWNDYDNQITGCLFADNQYGIRSWCGNYYVSSTAFARSSIADALITCHASSFRRVTSVGSTAFLGGGVGGGCGSPTKLQSVLVSRWGNASNSSQAVPAVALPGRGPLLIFDSVFELPLSPNSSVVAMGGYPQHGADQQAVLSNVTARNVTAPFWAPVNMDDTKGWQPANFTVINLPDGDPEIAAQLPALSASSAFFRSAWRMPGRIFDAVRGFNASNAGAWESHLQLQACIDAAAAAGGGAMCYLPAGDYAVNDTLRLCGADFSLTGGGSGFTTMLSWRGPAAPGNVSVVLAAGPAAGPGCVTINVTVEKINAFTNAAPGVLDFVASRAAAVPASPAGRHPAFAMPGGGDQTPRVSLVFDSFYFQSAGGAVLCGLAAGDSVTGPLWDGDLEVLDSAAATVLASFYTVGGGGLVVGRSPAGPAPVPGPHGGLLAAVAMVASASSYDVLVYNSSSVAAADFYTETAHSSVYAEGDGASAGGLVALSYAKANLNGGWALAVTQDFAGTVSLSGATAAYGGLNVSVRGSRAPTRLLLWGNALWLNDTTYDVAGGGGAELSAFAQACVSVCTPQQAIMPPAVHADTPAQAAAALDAFRRVGIADHAINFPGA